MAGREGTGRPLAVDAQTGLLSADAVRLHLGDIVADVVDHLDPELPRPSLEDLLERQTNPVGDELAVGEGEVGGGVHRPHVALPLLRLDRSAAQLRVRKIDGVVAGRPEHHLQEVVAHLVAEPPRAGVDGDGDLPGLEPQGARRRAVVDLGDPLHLDEVIARSEGAELRPAALLGARGHLGRLRALEPAALLDVQQIVALAEAVLHRPDGPVLENPVDPPGVEPEILAV